MKLLKLQVLTLVALTAVVACEREPGDDDLAADSLAANDTTGNLPTEPVVTNLDDVNDSGISGEATATHSAQEVTVSILLKEGAQANVTYPAHIHTGTCETGGPVAVELAAVTNLQSSRTMSLSDLPSGQPAFVQVHSPEGAPVACGNMEGHEGHDTAGDTARTTTGY